MAGEPAQKARPNKMEATEERHLIEAAQRDPVCFAELYESYFELVYVYVERRAQLFHLVDELAEDQRRVVVMRFAEEKSIGEIARELGRSEGAVKQLQFRALENLRKKLTTEDTEKNKELPGSDVSYG